MIWIKNVFAGYPGQKVLANISLKIPDSGCIALTGPSGIGKTTLLRLLAGLIPIQCGQIIGLKNLRISLLFQEDRLLPWCTAYENVLLAMRKPEPQRVNEMLTKLEIFEPDHYPVSFSGGMQRRIALARALCFDCDLLLLDEPFKGLDNALRDRISPIVLAAAPTIVMATHDQEDILRLNAKEVFLPEINEE